MLAVSDDPLILFLISDQNVLVKVIVTTGPSYEPIDDVRRLTNFSTGELGTLLADELSSAGCEVFLLRGAGATFPDLPRKAQVVPFTTNDDLLTHLQKFGAAGSIDAVLHAAALCDFKVQSVVADDGQQLGASSKIESRAGAITLRLEPAKKILPCLRDLFPRASIVGWKYELAGTREQAFAKAWRQIEESRGDACVLNGQAYGPGFAFCRAPQSVTELRDKTELARFLATWVKSGR